MQCPRDDNELVLINRDGADINYCPKCDGVWLDRKDLNVIIEKSCSIDEDSGGKEKKRVDHPKFRDTSIEQAEGGYKGPGDSYFGRLFNFHKL
jgi:uncharacterized protein